MIEILSEDHSKSLGCFKNFKAAKGTLNELVVSGELGESPSLVIDSYKNNVLQQRTIATYSAYFGKWGVEEPPQVGVSKKRRKKMQRKKHWCKIYKSPVQCFKEGFPDWMNRVYQPV